MVLSAIPNFKHRMVIMFIYSTGARVSECVNIKITDIDSKRMQVNIQEGKGLKKRKVPLSPFLLSALRKYYKYYHLVFTIPHELNPLCLKNKKLMGMKFCKSSAITKNQTAPKLSLNLRNDSQKEAASTLT